MSRPVVIGGLTYYVPEVGESNWGQNVSDMLVAIAANISGGGFFTIVSVSTSPVTVVSGRTYLVDTSAARQLNLPAPAIGAYLLVRDTAGTASTYNITIHRNGGEKIDGTAADKVLSVNNGQWWLVSDGTDWFTLLDFPIPASKLSALTASRAVVTDSSGFIAPSAATAAEVAHLSGVTSAIQTQITTNCPVGAEMMWPVATAPTGWLIEDGKTVGPTGSGADYEGTQYKPLYDLIQDTFGGTYNWAGAGKINLPDMREAAPVGVGTRGSGVTAHDAFTAGEFKDDQSQGHKHENYVWINATAFGASNYIAGAINNASGSALGPSGSAQMVAAPYSDGTNGTPRTGTVTRGKRLGKYFIIKY